MTSEGYTKFQCQWEKGEPKPDWPWETLNFWRTKLYALGLVGALPDGVGFGNLSQRLGNSTQFLISGTRTGKFPELSREHYTRVQTFDLANNRLVCQGPIPASSESLSHAAIYQAESAAKAVIHVHHRMTREKLRDRFPTTGPQAGYGTPEIALEILRLLNEKKAQASGLIIMGGHPDGILAYGRDMDEAGRRLLACLETR